MRLSMPSSCWRQRPSSRGRDRDHENGSKLPDGEEASESPMRMAQMKCDGGGEIPSEDGTVEARQRRSLSTVALLRR
jgi:hypothetical protein